METFGRWIIFTSATVVRGCVLGMDTVGMVFVSESLRLFVCLSVFVCLSMSVCLCLSVCLFICLSTVSFDGPVDCHYGSEMRLTASDHVRLLSVTISSDLSPVKHVGTISSS